MTCIAADLRTGTEIDAITFLATGLNLSCRGSMIARAGQA